MITSKKPTSADKIVRTCLLALLMLSCAGVLRAQEQRASPDNKHPVSSEQKQATGASAGRGQGPGRQLAHESREAAGEEKDEMAEFKQSASVQLIARLTGLKDLQKIQKAMQEAQKASEDARRRLAEIESRLMKLDVEIGMMRDAAEKEAAAEEVRIKAAAEEDARKIVASAEQEIAAAAKAARRQLTAYAADLAVGLARKQIHVDAATDQALVRNFSGQLGASSNDSGKENN